MSDEILGRIFGRLRAVDIYSVVKGITRYICKCECGNRTVVIGSHLKSGHTKSCGCLRKRIKPHPEVVTEVTPPLIKVHFDENNNIVARDIMDDRWYIENKVRLQIYKYLRKRD